MNILGIETSCDETALSLIQVDPVSKSLSVRGNTVHSQIDMHVPYGGVFPVLAKREHQKNLIPVLVQTLKQAGAYKEIPQTVSPSLRTEIENILAKDTEMIESFLLFATRVARPDISYISVTTGPGLEPALWVGIHFARALACLWNVPLIPSHHMEGHILTALIKKTENSYELLDTHISYPALSLLISGGHTQLVLIERIGSYKIIGDTRDDAVGECFDKVARMLGLAYPGGPKISKLAAFARENNIQSPEPLPRPMIDSDNFDFSFSVLKTAVLYLVKKIGLLDERTIQGIAREVEDAVTDVIVAKVRKALETYGIGSIVVGGGVIANTLIRTRLEKLAQECSVNIFLPQFDHSTDNGLMIALAGYYGIERATSYRTELKAAGTVALGPRI